MKIIIATSVTIALTMSTAVLAQTIFYNDKLPESANQISDIRLSIDFNDTLHLVTKKNKIAQPNITNLFPTYIVSLFDALSSVTSIMPVIDNTITGSIVKKKYQPKEKIIWEKFDRYGNLIK